MSNQYIHEYKCPHLNIGFCDDCEKQLEMEDKPSVNIGVKKVVKMGVNLRRQYNEVEDNEVEDNEVEDIEKQLISDDEYITIYKKDSYISMIYPKNTFIKHLETHFENNQVFGPIRKLPNDYWIKCNDVEVLSIYKVFSIINQEMHCYTKEQFDEFMEPGLRLQLIIL
jgi:hypothetical protein